MKKKKISLVLSVLFVPAAFLLGALLTRFIYTGVLFERSPLSARQMTALNQAQYRIEQNAIEEHDTDSVVAYALKGMAASLEDGYAYYYTAEELAAYEDSAAGKIEGGIGATVTLDGDQCVLSEIFHGLGAAKAGLRPGDVLTEVEDQPVAGLALSDVIAMVKGPVDTSVRLTVLRDGKELAFSVVRSDGQRDMTEYAMLENGILYTRIISFHGNAADTFREALEYGKRNAYRGLLVDLRGNPGGEVNLFAQIADLLLPEGETFTALDRSGNKVYSCTSDSACIDRPIVVLINGDSASASEALTGALRDMGGAQVVGTQSFGKGIMQTSYTLATGGAIKFTTAKYYLPSGQCIHGEGITPDVTVELPEELIERPWRITDENDVQKQKALEVLTNRIG